MLKDCCNFCRKRQARLVKRFEVGGSPGIDDILESCGPDDDSDGELDHKKAVGLPLPASSATLESRERAGEASTILGALSLGSAKESRMNEIKEPSNNSEELEVQPGASAAVSDGNVQRISHKTSSLVIPLAVNEAGESSSGRLRPSGMTPGRVSTAPTPNLLLRRLLDPDYSFSRPGSCDGTPPMSPSVRRPRRFEVDGGDRSSFLFADR